jgi:hypothetical protein
VADDAPGDEDANGLFSAALELHNQLCAVVAEQERGSAFDVQQRAGALHDRGNQRLDV